MHQIKHNPTINKKLIFSLLQLTSAEVISQLFTEPTSHEMINSAENPYCLGTLQRGSPPIKMAPQMVWHFPHSGLAPSKSSATTTPGACSELLPDRRATNEKSLLWFYYRVQMGPNRTGAKINNHEFLGGTVWVRRWKEESSRVFLFFFFFWEISDDVKTIIQK